MPPPSYVKAGGFKGRIDRCQEFEFVAPSTVLQWTGAIDVGAAFTDAQRDFRFQFRLFHGLTPETETTCFYFWSVANGYRQNEPEATEQLYREIAPTLRLGWRSTIGRMHTLAEPQLRQMSRPDFPPPQAHSRLALRRPTNSSSAKLIPSLPVQQAWCIQPIWAAAVLPAE